MFVTIKEYARMVELPNNAVRILIKNGRLLAHNFSYTNGGTYRIWLNKDNLPNDDVDFSNLPIIMDTQFVKDYLIISRAVLYKLLDPRNPRLKADLIDGLWNIKKADLIDYVNYHR